ncbi:hypothetical protein DL96DRAFT_1462999 [Flagelloscypha sp. PMI_526]|nr:hypothetical protein DL96DRAFT_1462999 [Flagelloscypha sp. PMI_526]
MGDPTTIWRPDNTKNPSPSTPGSPIYRPDIQDYIEERLHDFDSELRSLSLKIHSNGELKFEEYFAHDLATSFLATKGFEVVKKYHLDTAWSATFEHKQGGRTIGINSEMDGLPFDGKVAHACGHNLIFISGIGVALALREALLKFDISGKIVLLGTPAEEGGSGKVKLLEKDAYKGMDICIMCHPAPGPERSVSLSSCLALQRITATYRGHTAHAALSPWEGRNAQDAAVLAYNNISALRQQLRPSYRVHGIIEGKDWAVNRNSNRIWALTYHRCFVRTPTKAMLEGAVKRVVPCLEAAAHATGCELELDLYGSTYDLVQNTALGNEVATIVKSRYGFIDYEWGIYSASTDFGNVTYELPSLHPGFAIPTVLNGGNHTREFAAAAAEPISHSACMDVTKALAGASIRILLDDEFFAEVKRTFEEDKARRETQG